MTLDVTPNLPLHLKMFSNKKGIQGASFLMHSDIHATNLPMFGDTKQPHALAIEAQACLTFDGMRRCCLGSLCSPSPCRHVVREQDRSEWPWISGAGVSDKRHDPEQYHCSFQWCG